MLARSRYALSTCVLAAGNSRQRASRLLGHLADLGQDDAFHLGGEEAGLGDQTAGFVMQIMMIVGDPVGKSRPADGGACGGAPALFPPREAVLE